MVGVVLLRPGRWGWVRGLLRHRALPRGLVVGLLVPVLVGARWQRRRCGCALLRVLVAECQVVALASALVVGLPVAWVAAVVWARHPATGGVPPSNRRRILVVGCVGLYVPPAAGPLIGQMTVAVGACRLGGGPLKTRQGSERRTKLLGTRSAARSGGLLPRWRRCWWRSRHGCAASG